MYQINEQTNGSWPDSTHLVHKFALMTTAATKHISSTSKKLTWNDVKNNGAQSKEIKRRIVVLKHLDCLYFVFLLYFLWKCPVNLSTVKRVRIGDEPAADKR